MKRGTRVLLNSKAKFGTWAWEQVENDPAPRLVGKVSSRKTNGWLRVTIESSGKTISIRNGPGVEKWVPIDFVPISPVPIDFVPISPVPTVEDEATAEPETQTNGSLATTELEIEATLALERARTTALLADKRNWYTDSFETSVETSDPIVESRSPSPLQIIEEKAATELYAICQEVQRRKSGYLLYADEVRAEVKAKLWGDVPEDTKLKPQDLVRAITTKWVAEEQEVRDKWNAKAKTPALATAGTSTPVDEIDSMSNSEDDEFDIVDPVGDAYGDLTPEQQLVVGRLIGQFKRMNSQACEL